MCVARVCVVVAVVCNGSDAVLRIRRGGCCWWREVRGVIDTHGTGAQGGRGERRQERMCGGVVEWTIGLMPFGCCAGRSDNNKCSALGVRGTPCGGRTELGCGAVVAEWLVVKEWVESRFGIFGVSSFYVANLRRSVAPQPTKAQPTNS